MTPLQQFVYTLKYYPEDLFPYLIVGVIVAVAIGVFLDSQKRRPSRNEEWYREETRRAAAEADYLMKQAELDETRRFLKRRK